MPAELILLTFIVSGMAVLFVTEKLSADLTAVTGLLLLILFGYLTPTEAFSGFSSSVVLTLIPMFMLGAGLRLTGVTDLLANIVINAILSSPFPLQQFAFDQPNIAILYFPFSWLPTFVVPVVLFCHLASIRQLLKKEDAVV